MSRRNLIIAALLTALATPAFAGDDTELIMGKMAAGMFPSEPVGVRNKSDHPIKSVLVTCGFFDANNELIGSGYGGVLNVQPGQTGYGSVLAPDKATRADCSAAITNK